MSGRNEQNGPGRSRRRPRLMTLFTVLMLLMGGRVFVTSASDLYRLATGKAEV